jgi:hypothetical protein
MQFLDDDNRMKTAIGLMEFALKPMALDARPKRSRWVMVKNLMKRVSSRKDRFPKPLFALSRCWSAEDDGSGDLLSRSQMHVDEWDEVASAAQQQKLWNLDMLVCFVAICVLLLLSGSLPRVWPPVMAQNP